MLLSQVHMCTVHNVNACLAGAFYTSTLKLGSHQILRMMGCLSLPLQKVLLTHLDTSTGIGHKLAYALKN